MALDYSSDNKGTMRKLSNISELFTYTTEGYPTAPYPWDVGTSDVKWESGADYVVGDLVTHNEELYHSLSIHTSTNSDAPGTAGAAAYWKKYVPTTTSNIGWVAGDTYADGQFVSHNDKLYYANADHADSTTAPGSDTTNWTEYASGDGDLEWKDDGTYQSPEFVSYLGNLYTCLSTAPLVSSNTPPPQDPSNWQLYTGDGGGDSDNNIEWVSGKTYKNNQFVSFLGKLYYNSTGADWTNTMTPPADPDHWTEFKATSG